MGIGRMKVGPFRSAQPAESGVRPDRVTAMGKQTVERVPEMPRNRPMADVHVHAPDVEPIQAASRS